METTTALSDQLALQRLQAMGEPTRLRIVTLLSRGERCVCELQDDLGAAQSRLSFHLRKLKEAGLIADRPMGRWTYYSLVPDAFEELRAFLTTLEPSPRLWPLGGAADRNESCCG